VWQKIKDVFGIVFAIIGVVWAVVILGKRSGDLNVKESINKSIDDVLSRSTAERRKRIKNPLQ